MRLVVAELRDSWRAWAGVSLTLATATFCLSLSALVLGAGLEMQRRQSVEHLEVVGLLVTAGVNLAFCVLVGMSVIGAATGLVIASRRGSLARLGLAGCSPGQLVGIVLGQLAAACLACGVVGALAALACYRPAMDWLGDNRQFSYPSYAPRLDLLVIAVAGTVLVALLGGLQQAVRASRIPPVEALRQAQAPQPERRSALRWVAFVLLVGLVVTAWRGTVAALESSGDEMRSMALQTPMLVLPLVGLAFVLGREVFMNGLTRLWTGLVPGSSATWHLARHTALGKGERLHRSITPSMFAVGLLVGMVMVGESLNATLAASAEGFQLDGVGLEAMLPVVGLALLLALSGAVSSLVMMSSQREGELALDGVIGATPAQQVAIPVLEGVIVSVTATLLGLAMGALAVACQASLLPLIYPQVRVVVPWASLAVVGVLTTVVIAAATTLPVLGSLRQPPNRVLARLVAE